MPNRIIKESAFTSDKISGLTDFEFRLWVGLITAADDFGRVDARPAILKGRIFPLRERITYKDIGAGIQRLAAKGCVSLYTVDGKPYLWFPTWEEHQRVRDCKPKYPGPEEGEMVQISASAAICGNSPQLAASCGLIQSNPIQSESNPNPNPTRAGSGEEEQFEVFWKAYPRKVNKQTARKSFSKAIGKVSLETMLCALEKQKRSPQWVRDKGQYIPHPSTWLNQGRWEDEMEVKADGYGNGFGTDASFRNVQIGTVL